MIRNAPANMTLTFNGTQLMILSHYVTIVTLEINCLFLPLNPFYQEELNISVATLTGETPALLKI
jgi:hypothetical protein